MVAQFSALGLIRINQSGVIWINSLSIPPYPLMELNVKFSLVFLSDHDLVHRELNLDNVYSHGPGGWRLNLDLLSDKDFCAVIVDVIHDWWELLKDSIRKTAIDFGKQKFQNTNSDRVRLTNSLITVKQQLIAGNSTARFTIRELKQQTFAIHGGQPELKLHKSCALHMSHGQRGLSRRAPMNFSRPCRFATTLILHGFLRQQR